MIKRILAAILLGLLLLALLAYSQLRPPQLKISGVIEADEIRLGSQVGGRVDKVLVSEGQRVQAGQVLVTLEEYDLDERHAESLAALAAAQAQLDRSQAGYRAEEIAQAEAQVQQSATKLQRLRNGPRQEEINAAQARQDLAQAQLDRAQQTYRRTQDLFVRETGAVTRDDVDRVTEELKVAEFTLQVRREELKLLQKGTRQEDIDEAQAALEEAQSARDLVRNGYRPEEIREAQAQVDGARAALKRIEAQREELEIRSPVEGTIEAIELQKGDLVRPGAPVLSVMDDRNLWVRSYLPERWLKHAANKQVKVTVSSMPQQRFPAEITFVARQAEFTPSNIQTEEERAKQVFRIHVTLQKDQHLLRPGMTADVWLQADTTR